MANDLNSREGEPIFDRETPKDYTFTVIPREDLMKMPEEDFVAYHVRLKGIAEILDEMVLGTEMLRATRQADLDKRIAAATAAEEGAKKGAADADLKKKELEAKKQELDKEIDEKTAEAARNAQETEELRQRRAKLGG